jgi:hypothetical protein
MTQEIIDMARQSGWTDDLLEVSFVTPMLEAFANLVAAKATAKEREVCAKVCEHQPHWVACAAAIRARGEA